MTECEIVSVETLDSTKILPKIVSFQNGTLQSNENLDCRAFIDPDSKKTVITVASDRLVYTGVEEEDPENELFHSLIAIRNKRTNTVRLVPVSNVSLNAYINKTNEVLNNTLSSSDLNARTLYKEFGSKKSKRKTEQQEKMKVNVSHVEEELTSIAREIHVDEKDLNAPTMVDGSLGLPQVNRNASTVDTVYDLYSMITKSQLDSLKTLAEDVKQKHVISEQLTPFVLDCVNELSKTSSASLEKYQILLYVDAICKFFKINAHEVKKKKLSIGVYPQTIVEKILKDYTVLSENNRTRPLSMRDKAACFVLTLSLIAMNYRVNLESLIKSMSVGIKKFLEIGRMIGAQPLGGKDKTIIVLKLPLASPVKSFKRRKH